MSDNDKIAVFPDFTDAVGKAITACDPAIRDGNTG
jgi:hypothetical protein